MRFYNSGFHNNNLLFLSCVSQIYLTPSIQRTCVLQWTAAVCVYLGAEQLPDHLPSLLGPIYRELSDSSKRAGEELYSLAQEVVELMKGVCGREAFSSAYAQVHQSVGGVRDKRRMQAALEVCPL